MWKVAMVKIPCLGDKMLVLGLCERIGDKDYWHKFQMYTCECYLNCHYTYDPDQEFKLYHSQEGCDKAAAGVRRMAQDRSRFHGEEVRFNSINKSLRVTHQPHDFTLLAAEAVELTAEEVLALRAEMTQDGWEEFDIWDWGK